MPEVRANYIASLILPFLLTFSLCLSFIFLRFSSYELLVLQVAVTHWLVICALAGDVFLTVLSTVASRFCWAAQASSMVLATTRSQLARLLRVVFARHSYCDWTAFGLSLIKSLSGPILGRPSDLSSGLTTCGMRFRRAPRLRYGV